MDTTHNEEDFLEVIEARDEKTGSNNSNEVSIVNVTVDISDEEIMEILNYGLKLQKSDQR